MAEPLKPYGNPQDLFCNIFLEIISWDLSGQAVQEVQAVQ
jgi:hypothetical protein